MYDLLRRQSGIALVALWFSASVVITSSLQTQPKLPGDTTPTLPGGASQMQETHGDWRVTCAQHERRLCTVSQQQADKESRQLLLAIELTAVATDRAVGTIVLPFGLAVAQPITLRIGDGPSTTLAFRTCLPAGCVVPVAFDPPMITALRKETVLLLKATAVGRLAGSRVQDLPQRFCKRVRASLGTHEMTRLRGDDLRQ